MPKTQPTLSHEETWKLLPWLANNSLQTDEMEGVLEHQKTCSACRDELVFLPELRLACEQNQPAASTQESLPHQLSSRINTYERASRSFFQQAGEQIARWTQGRGSQILLAQTALVVVLVGGVWSARPDLMEKPGQTPARFQTLSQQLQTPDSHLYLRLIFAGTTPESDLRNLLLELEATVVDGPLSLGAYVIRLPLVEDLEPLIRELRGHKEVSFVEPTVLGR